MKISKILIPLDFSEFGQEAIQIAEQWAQTFGASIHLLHVVDLREVYSLDTEFIQTAQAQLEPILREHANNELNKISKSLKSPNTIEVRLGAPLDEIEQCIQENKIDLVIIPTHGRTGLKHVLMGSIAEKVVRHSPCPVLTFRPQKFKNP